MNGRRPITSEVILNVYDLTPMNEWVHPVGLGAYHSGIEIDGREYTYAGGGGIFNHDPRKAPGAHFREAVKMGSFSGEPGTLSRALDALRDEFGPERYNVLTRNCNSFSSALCEELLGRPIPGYVNRLAWMGSWFSCLLPPSILGEAPVIEGGSSSGFSVHVPQGRALTASSGSKGARARGGGSHNAFQGSGMSLAAGSSGVGVSRDGSVSSGGRERELSDRRERMRAAALRRVEAAAAAPAGAGETPGGVGAGSNILKSS